MTLWAARDGKNRIKVSCTYGPVTFDVTEDPSHVRHFWGQLGKILEESEQVSEETEGA